MKYQGLLKGMYEVFMTGIPEQSLLVTVRVGSSSSNMWHHFPDFLPADRQTCVAPASQQQGSASAEASIRKKQR